jgi:hypothetical protein
VESNIQLSPVLTTVCSHCMLTVSSLGDSAANLTAAYDIACKDAHRSWAARSADAQLRQIAASGCGPSPCWLCVLAVRLLYIVSGRWKPLIDTVLLPYRCVCVCVS